MMVCALDTPPPDDIWRQIFRHVPVDYNSPPPLEEQISVEHGRLVRDFNEYTFHAPRLGFFLGDSPIHHADLNPIPLFSPQEMTLLPSSTSSCPFDVFPVEILNLIFFDLDICSVIAFGGTNKRAQQLVESIDGFKMAATFPRLLSGIWQLQCRSYNLKS